MNDNFEYMGFSVFEYGDFDTLTDTVVKINKDWLHSGKAEINNDAIRLTDYYDPEGGCHLPEKFTCWKSSRYPERIFFMSNFMDGWNTMCRVIQMHLKCPWIMFKISNSTDWQYYPMNQFMYSREPGEERYVMSYYDDTRWVFYETGEPAECEDLENYKARLKKHRLNKEILLEYMRRLGIDFYDIDEDVTHYLNFTRTQW